MEEAKSVVDYQVKQENKRNAPKERIYKLEIHNFWDLVHPISSNSSKFEDTHVILMIKGTNTWKRKQSKMDIYLLG